MTHPIEEDARRRPSRAKLPEPGRTYTDAPMSPQAFPAWDGGVSIDYYKAMRIRFFQIERRRRNPMLLATRADGTPLYRLSPAGHLTRTKDVSPGTRKAVLERDGHCCVWCGSTKQLEVDHIVRYADGGSNTAENLRTLCHSCHGSRGGRA